MLVRVAKALLMAFATLIGVSTLVAGTLAIYLWMTSDGPFESNLVLRWMYYGLLAAAMSFPLSFVIAFRRSKSDNPGPIKPL